MALINLAEKTYTVIPEGKQVVRVKNAVAMPLAKPVAVEITVEDCNGSTLRTTYDLNNEKAVFALTCFLETIIPDLGNSIDANDIPKIVGKYVLVEISHTVKPSTKRPGETVTFPKIAKALESAVCFPVLGICDDYDDGAIE